MQEIDEDHDTEPVLELLTASQDMARACWMLRGTIVLPFSSPTSSDAYWNAWHERESHCRKDCNEAIVYWIQHRRLPLLGADDVAFYLCRRFDQVSNFVQNLFSEDGKTVFYSEISLEHLLLWLLIDWWDAHGKREAFFEDLAAFEEDEEA
ncbi:MAG: hypothetical protein WCS43_15935 [Verrucomicrobiota bacterium]